jgi:hypothetical protein
MLEWVECEAFRLTVFNYLLLFCLLKCTSNSVNKFRKKKIFPLDQTQRNYILIHNLETYFLKIRFNVVFLSSFWSFNLSFSKKFLCKNFWSFKLSFSKKNFPVKTPNAFLFTSYHVHTLKQMSPRNNWISKNACVVNCWGC